MRTALSFRGPLEEGKYDPFEHPGYPGKNQDLVPLSARIYMAYNHTEKTSVNIIHQPYGSECIPELRDFLGFSEQLHIDCDPFGVHLLYMAQITRDWRKVVDYVMNEIEQHVSFLLLL